MAEERIPLDASNHNCDVPGCVRWPIEGVLKILSFVCQHADERRDPQGREDNLSNYTERIDCEGAKVIRKLVLIFQEIGNCNEEGHDGDEHCLLRRLGRVIWVLRRQVTYSPTLKEVAHAELVQVQGEEGLGIDHT